MKKVLIAVLVIMTVFCASVFAAEGYEDYTGITFGIGYSGASYKYLGLEHKETCNPLTITASEYAFFQGSPVGIYGDISLVIPLKFKKDDVESDAWHPAVFVAVGPAFRIYTGNKLSVLLGAGFHFYSTSYSTNYDYWKEVRTYYGAGAELYSSYRFSKNFAFNGGVTASFFFANYGRHTDRYFPSYDISYDSFAEIRVVPKLGFYYVY